MDWHEVFYCLQNIFKMLHKVLASNFSTQSCNIFVESHVILGETHFREICNWYQSFETFRIFFVFPFCVLLGTYHRRISRYIMHRLFENIRFIVTSKFIWDQNMFYAVFLFQALIHSTINVCKNVAKNVFAQTI